MCICVGLRLIEVDVVFIGQTFIVQNTLLLGVDHGLLFNSFLESNERTKDCSDGARDALDVDLSVALRTAHEGKVDLCCSPSVLQKVNYAASVEHVATAKLGASLCSKFARVANATKLVGIDVTLVMLGCATCLDAWETLFLICDTITVMAAVEGLEANRNGSFLLDGLFVASVNLDSWGVLFQSLQAELWDLDQDSVSLIGSVTD